MVLAAPGPLLTPPPYSSPPKTPHQSYSVQTRSQNEEKTAVLASAHMLSKTMHNADASEDESLDVAADGPQLKKERAHNSLS